MATISARKSKSGMRYTAQIRIQKNGRSYTQSKTFSTSKLAKDWAKEQELKLEKSSNFKKVLHEDVTIKELIETYEKEVGGTKKFGRSKKSHLNFLKNQEIAKQTVKKIDETDYVEHCRVRAASGAQPSTVLNDMVYLRMVLRYAHRKLGAPVDLDEFKEARITAKENGFIAKSGKRKRRPTDEELMKLIDYFRGKTRSKYPMDLIIWFEIYSARRTGEMCRIMRHEIYKQDKNFLARGVKHPKHAKDNHKISEIPKKGWKVIKEILKRVPDVDGRLLPLNPRTISSKFTNACKLLGIEDLHFYDLKHEALSRLAEDGYTIPEMAEVSLHEDWKSLQVYVNMKSRKAKRLEYCPKAGYKYVKRVRRDKV